MKVVTFENEADWKAYRLGKLGGTRVNKIKPAKNKNDKKIGFYELIAEKMGVPTEEENPMERGKRLESEAIKKFEEQYGYTVDTTLKIWVSDDNSDITCSPDGSIGDEEAVECKCLSSARHIQAIIENKIPDDYEDQAIQYFVCNTKLKRLYFVMYDPRIVARPLVVFILERADIEDRIESNYTYQVSTLQEVSEWVSKLTNF
jgi:hypothetical protein